MIAPNALDVLLCVDVPGEPVGAARPRVMRNGITFMPKQHRAWEDKARRCVRAEWRGEPLDEPVAVRVVAVHARLKRLLLRQHGGTCAVHRYDPGRIPHDRKPDADNVAKLALDATVKAGVIADDSRVCSLVVEQWFAAEGEPAHVRIEVMR